MATISVHRADSLPESEKAKDLAILDIPAPRIPALGGLKQQHVRGTIAGAGFESNVMPAGAGRLALSVSKAMTADACLCVADTAEIQISSVGRD